MSKVSVIIPVYNGSRYLKQAIESALAQTHKPFEIIVVDDGSTDGTAKVAAAFEDRVRYFYQDNQGPSAARNVGLKIAQGNFVAFLDSDDLWPESKIQLQLDYFKNDPDLQVVQGRVQYFCLSPQTDQAKFEKAYEPVFSFNLPAALYKKSAFTKVGMFNEQMRFSEDVDWFMRAREQNLQMLFIKETALYYRRHSANMTQAKDQRDKCFTKAVKMSLDRRRKSGPGQAQPLPRMMPDPLVSVILAVKNGERFVAQALRSVFMQEYLPFEIIVVDGRSTDRTAEIARSFGVRYIRQEGDGIPDAYNTGIEAAQGELVAFISHDDQWAPNKLSLQVNHLRLHPEVQFTVAKVRFFLEPGFAPAVGFREELLEGSHVAYIMETLVARKSLFSQIGKYDRSYPIGEDVDWFARAKDNNIPAAVIPEVLVYKRIHDRNASGHANLNNRLLLRILKRSLERKRLGGPELKGAKSG